MKKVFYISFIYTFVYLSSCNNSKDLPKNSEVTKDISAFRSDTVRSKEIIANDTNFKGIMTIPEQMALCILDSASSRDASKKMEENYNKILKDVDLLKVRVADQPGCIFYFSSPEKIVFETFMILKEKPKQTPKYSKPVILEATLGLLYDHYGTFNTIHQSYAKIENILKSSGYKQVGPTREIYVLQEDTAKWRTRIIVPIAKR